MYNHNKAQQSKNRVHISCDILYFMWSMLYLIYTPASFYWLFHVDFIVYTLKRKRAGFIVKKLVQTML